MGQLQKDAEMRPRDVKCPECGAEPGDLCATKSNRPRRNGMPHNARIDAASGWKTDRHLHLKPPKK